jgi:hypothetical protein
MVVCSSDCQRISVQAAHNSTQVRKYFRLNFRRDCRPTLLGAENYVNQEIAVGVGHNFRPAGALGSHSWASHGLRRGLHFFAAPRLRLVLSPHLP